jgi:UDP-N-acetylenolpyruvoylglucosamine reductase
MEFVFALTGYDEESFMPQVSKALEKRTESASRDKYPNVWKNIDKMNSKNKVSGEVFKRPQGFFAGKLIEDAGLRGYRIGGAKISEKHCGFIVNTGDATAGDVIKLIEYVKERVYQCSGVILEHEVKILGG